MHHHIIWWLLIMHTPPLLLPRRSTWSQPLCLTTDLEIHSFLSRLFRLHYAFNCSTVHVRLGAAMHLVYLMMIRWTQHKYIINRQFFFFSCFSSIFQIAVRCVNTYNTEIWHLGWIEYLVTQSESKCIEQIQCYERNKNAMMDTTWIEYRDRYEYACCSPPSHNGKSFCFQ